MMESLEYYELVAKKILLKYNPIMAKKIFADTDAFGDIVTQIMVADWKYREEKSPSYSIGRFRRRRFIWAIQSYLKKIYKNNRCQSIPIEDCGCNSDEQYRKGTITNVLFRGSCHSSKDIVDSKDLLNHIISCGVLDNRELTVLRSRYILDKTMQEIGDDLGISRQRVKQILDECKNKLLNKFDCEKLR